MSIELIVASVAITCALVLYTFGVFGERRSGTLSLRHVLLFWGGLVCDTTGTMIMSNIAQQSSAGGFGIHAVTGLLAIVLMLVHAVWATVTYVRHNERGMHAWLVPYIIGMLVGIPMIHLQAVCAIGTSVVVVAVLAFVLFRGGKGHAHTAAH